MTSPFPVAVSPTISSYYHPTPPATVHYSTEYSGLNAATEGLIWKNLSNATEDSGSGFDCSKVQETINELSDTFNKFPAFYRPLLLFMYIFVAFVGATGNLLVIAAVLRNPQMRIPRNYFIINLALSDLLMCTITVPFTWVILTSTFWSLGELTCKFVSTSQGINLFVSTMSITAIGFDRYWVILFPTKTNQQRIVIIICFVAIWTLSILFATPMFLATALFKTNFCGQDLTVCMENWKEMHGIRQDVYSIGCIVFQYVLPLTMLSFLYGRIIWRLKGRASRFGGNRGGSQFDDGGRRRSVETRQRRMNILLVCIVVIFASFWLPLNIHNTLVSNEVIQYNVPRFAFCHIIGVASSCINPILYGVFNDNFRNEFKTIFTKLKIIPAYRAVRQCCRKTIGLSGATSSDHRRRSSNMTTGRVTNNNNNNNTVVTVNDNTTVVMTRRDRASNATSVKRKETKQQQQPQLIVIDNDFNSSNDNDNDKLVACDKIADTDDTTAMLLSPSAANHSPTNTACSTGGDSCFSGNNLETATLLGGCGPPEIDTTVVSVNEDTLPLCRRNLIVNGLHAKNYLLKTDLV